LLRTLGDRANRGGSRRLAITALLGAGLAQPALAAKVGGVVPVSRQFEVRLLAAHNQERSALKLPPMTWDPKLAAAARRWAAYLAGTHALVHSTSDPSDPDPDGENLWGGTSGFYSPEDMVGMWTRERSDFKPDRFPNNSRSGRGELGHYTQVVWRATTRIGCGVASDGEDDFLVCRYKEAGNVLGERPY